MMNFKRTEKFQSARVRLTAWYLVIIMLVSLFFSLMIYLGVSREFERGFRRAELRLHAEELGVLLPRRFSIQPEDLRPELRGLQPRIFFIEDLVDARKGILIRLMMINGVILVVSAAASYLMAGRTLAPLEKSMEEQKRFVADASHELRTPLTALKTSIEVALREKNISESQARGILKDSLGDVDKLSHLSTQLLHLSRLQQGAPLKVSTVDIAQVVRDAVKKMTPLAKQKKIVIRNKVTAGSIKAEPGQIEEMLTIFLDNAIKFTPDKGTITLQSSTEKKNLILTIRDTGIGIPEKHLPKIFDRFYRADSARAKGTIDGFGLGLSLAKQIIEAHGGSVRVESTVGKGTMFTIRVPRKQP